VFLAKEVMFGIDALPKIVTIPSELGFVFSVGFDRQLKLTAKDSALN
jgi:hypothetical protein